MEIRNKAEHDPSADLTVVDAYMRWALLAAEEVVGKNGLAVILRQAGLEQLINNYPPNQLKATFGLKFGDYANLSSGLLNFFGRAGKSMTLRIGRQSARYTIEQQGPLFGTAAMMAAKVLPIATQVKMGLSAGQAGFRKIGESVGEPRRLSLEDRGDRFAYIDLDDPCSAGKEADEPIGWIQTGGLQEALRWQTGKEFDVVQVACRSMGAPASVWEISKTPKVVEE